MPYYAHKGYQPDKTITLSYVAALLIKEMAQSYADVIVSQDMDGVLHELLDTSAHNLTVIYKEELQDMDEMILSEAVEQVRACITEIKHGIVDSGERLGVERLVDMITAHDTQPVLYSEKFRISGSPDKLLKLDDTMSLSIIRTGRAPQTGIWKDDRIRLTALAILVEEEYNCLVDMGVVEYARYGSVRKVKIKRTDRRKVLVLAGRIRKIKSGRLPKPPEGAPCEYCAYTEFCEVTPTLASRFF
jgi:CRISPR-associated exonuclease Cas4